MAKAKNNTTALPKRARLLIVEFERAVQQRAVAEAHNNATILDIAYASRRQQLEEYIRLLHVEIKKLNGQVARKKYKYQREEADMTTPVSMVLQSSKTYAVRMIIWNRMTKDGFRCAGVLEVREQRTVRTKTYSRRYAVQEISPGTDGRRFQITKPGGQERYHCLLTLSGKNDMCECHKGQKGDGQCVHLQALRSLRGAGHLPEASPQNAPSGANGQPSPQPAGRENAQPTAR